MRISTLYYDSLLQVEGDNTQVPSMKDVIRVMDKSGIVIEPPSRLVRRIVDFACQYATVEAGNVTWSLSMN